MTGLAFSVRARRLSVAAVGLVLGACTAVPTPYYTPSAESRNAHELGWIVTPRSTIVQKIDGHDVPRKYNPFAYDAQVGSWIAVAPGEHRLQVFYASTSYTSAASSEVVVESVGGKTNYVYGRAEAGIRYYNVLIDRPADEALIEELNDGML